jgi:hypothetical protein
VRKHACYPKTLPPAIIFPLRTPYIEYLSIAPALKRENILSLFEIAGGKIKSDTLYRRERVSLLSLKIAGGKR